MSFSEWMQTFQMAMRAAIAERHPLEGLRGQANPIGNLGSIPKTPVGCAGCGKPIDDPPPWPPVFYNVEKFNTCSFACAAEVFERVGGLGPDSE